MVMDKQTLIDNRTGIETAFNTLKESVEKQETATAVDREELVKLQGEYRAINNLIDELDNETLDPATTITAKEKK